MSPDPALRISKATQRRFILGKQGLYPARRWASSPARVAEAVRAGCVVQIDPLNVVARSHDITLYGRLQGYRPDHLLGALYEDRALFDYGGTVVIHPMEELPYYRVIMARKAAEHRWQIFEQEHPGVTAQVLDEVTQRGPLSTRDFKSETPRFSTYRSGKVAGIALYRLWLAGDLMTHSRRGFDRVFDLRERIAPPEHDRVASVEEAEAYFELEPFRILNLLTARSWRRFFAGTIERKVDAAEGTARFQALVAAGAIVPVALEHDGKEPYYVLADDLPLLEALHGGDLPDWWQPLDGAQDEIVLLAPLEIVSARGRARPLFDFEYLWEVYKPQEQRRWGYYTLPILHHDRLVARLDPKLDRTTGTLLIKGFWLEDGVTVDGAFLDALARGLRRFMDFAGAQTIDLYAVDDTAVRDGLRERIGPGS
jgi:uncharacterized protein YcaQ